MRAGSALLLLFAVLVGGSVASGFLSVTDFAREWITVTVRPAAIDVRGVYEYRNPLPIPWSQGLTVPFPVDAQHPAPPVVRVAVLSGPEGDVVEELPVRWLAGTPHVAVTVPARGTATVLVEYVQHSAVERGTYLLRTTQRWREPLEEATYTLRTHCTTVAQSSIELVEGRAHRLEFLPEEDWHFAWTARPGCAG